MISLDDELLVRFGIADALPAKYRTLRQEAPLSDPHILQLAGHIQRVADGQNFEIQKTLNKYADMVEQQRKLLFRKRSAVLSGAAVPHVLASQEPELYERLCRTYGADKVAAAEKRIMLVQLDKAWADHLEYAAYVKEGIHLEIIGNRNPLDVFNRLMIQAYADLDEKIETAVAEAFRSFDWSKGFIGLDEDSLKAPSATWTYIVNDRFLQNGVRLI